MLSCGDSRKKSLIMNDQGHKFCTYFVSFFVNQQTQESDIQKMCETKKSPYSVVADAFHTATEKH